MHVKPQITIPRKEETFILSNYVSDYSGSHDWNLKIKPFLQSGACIIVFSLFQAIAAVYFPQPKCVLIVILLMFNRKKKRDKNED